MLRISTVIIARRAGGSKELKSPFLSPCAKGYEKLIWTSCRVLLHSVMILCR
jgi:hypothetical protein